MGDSMPPVHKFLQSIDEDDFKILKEFAKQRKMTIQKFLRYEVFPQWLKIAHAREKAKKPD